VTYRALISRALAAGALAGVLLAGYLLVVTEPLIDDAIALEEKLAHEDAGEGHSHEDPLFTRSEQVGGGVAASLVFAIIASAIFGTVFAALRHRLPGRSDLARSGWLGAAAFGTVALVPALKYPPNPPAVGDPDTVGERTVLYLAIIVVSLVLVAVLTRVSGLLRHRLGDARRTVVVATLAIVAFGIVLAAFPGNPDSIDPAVPAGLVWDFRVRSIGGLALLWAAIGLGLGFLVERASPPTGTDAPVAGARA
jgi:predicted cobalt transporter CbtA